MLNLSPDNKRIAVNLQNSGNKNFEIWIGDVTRGTLSPFITDTTGSYDPEWSPDGRMAFSSDRSGSSAVFEKSTIGTGDAQPVVRFAKPTYASDWSADGRFILYQQSTALFAVPGSGERKPTLVLDSPSSKDEARFSPDGRWIAYNANDSGVFEVYVVSFPTAGRPIQISTKGGVQPRWRRDGKEMFYLTRDGTLMAVDVHSTAESIDVGQPKALFQTRLTPPSSEIEQYDVTADGQKFIVIKPPAESRQSMNLIVNWTSRLKN
jgi:Tol biopolymer transport system component